MKRWTTTISTIIFRREILFILLTIQNILSICVIFSNPLPIPPKTSIGLLTGITLLLYLVFLVLLKKKIIQIQSKVYAIDWFVLGYIVVNAISLLTSSYIFELTSFRLLLIAVMHYAVIRLLIFSEKEKKQMMHAIGITTMCVAVMSLFQMLFRDQAIIFAKRFLFGDSAFSIAVDLARGRGPQWGNIIVSFPFFIGSAMMMRKSKDLWKRVYIIVGIILISFSFIVSNFRWLTICFFIGTFLYLTMLYKSRLLSLALIKRLFVPFFFAITGGIIIASVVFQYNLIDRFLLKEKERDVTYTIGRTFLYQQAFSAFSASPLFGIGVGSYRYIVERPLRLHFYQIITEEGKVDEQTRESVSSHNDFLTLLAETGIFGALIFLGMSVLVFQRLVLVLKKSIKEKHTAYMLYALTLLTALSMFYLIGLFENSAPNYYIFVFFLYAVVITWFPLFNTSIDHQLKR